VDFVRAHMQAGQVYSHWGAVVDDVAMDPQKIEDILAQRPVFYDELRRTSPANLSASGHSPGHGASETLKCSTEGGQGRPRPSHAPAASGGNAETAGEPEERRRKRNLTPEKGGAETMGQRSVGDDALVAVATAGNEVRRAMQDRGAPTADARAADRRYNISVLAAAGLAEMHIGGVDGNSGGVQEGVVSGVGRQRAGSKKRACGPAALEKVMRKITRQRTRW
jgi:hypothetical protein